MARNTTQFGLSLFATMLVAAGSAEAQTAPTAPQALPPRGDTVLTRSRPELDPLGVRLGSFLLYPKMTLGETFTDNVFATEDNTDSDFITSLRPELSLESDWRNHALNFSTGMDKGFYASETDEDYLDFFAETDGRVDVTRDISVTGAGGVSRNHEARSDPDDFGGKKPTIYYLYDAAAAYNQRFGRFRTTLSGDFTRFDYENAPGEIQNQDRDRNVYAGALRLGYEIQPQYEAFVRFTGNRRLYDTTPDDVGIERDSYGVEGVAGVALDLGGILFGDVFAGYLTQQYDDNDLDSPQGFTFGGSLDWNVTTLTTLSFTVAQTIRETTEEGASSYRQTLGTIQADHELLRNLLVNANFSIGNNDYDGISRNDYIYTAGVGVRYLMNRWFYVNAGYRFTRRDSDDAPGGDADYTENAVLISLEGQF
jgi:hypothetical protein